MCSFFNMHVLAYLVSLSVSLEAGVNFIKSSNTTVPGAELVATPTYDAYEVNTAQEDVSNPRFLNNRPREGAHHLNAMRKTTDTEHERSKNRARNQRRHKTRSSKSISAKRREDVETVSQSNVYQPNTAQQDTIVNNNSNNNNATTTETSLNLNVIGTNETDSSPQTTQPEIQNKTTTTIEYSNVTNRSTRLAPQTTKSPTRQDTKQIKLRRHNKASTEGRSRNRPHRNHGRKHSGYNRRRYRTSPTSPRHTGHKRRQNYVSNTQSNRYQNRSTDNSKNSSPPDTTTINQTSGESTDEKLLSDKDSKDPTKEKTGLSEETVREVRLEMFIKTLADKLRVTPRDLMGRPKRRSAPRLPPALLEETLQDNANQRARDSDRFYAKDQKVIIPGRDLGRNNCIAKRSSGCYSFDLAGNVKGDVASAELWVYKTPDRNDTAMQTFMLYGLVKLESDRVLAENQIQRHDSNVREGWMVINITRTVTSWVQERKNKEMIAIRCATCVTRNYKALYGVKHGYTPLIIIKYDRTSLDSRYRRSDDEDCDPNFECCKRSLDINFRNIYMYNVLAPPALSVGYCYGSCNIISQYHRNHTVIRQNYRLQSDDASDELREQLKPCCVPISYKATQIILGNRDPTSTKVTLVPDAIVDQCGCV